MDHHTSEFLHNFIQDVENGPHVAPEMRRINSKEPVDITVTDSAFGVAPRNVLATRKGGIATLVTYYIKVTKTSGGFEIHAFDPGSGKTGIGSGEVAVVKGKNQPHDDAAYRAMIDAVGKWLVSAADSVV